MFEQIITHFNDQIETTSINTEDLTPYIAEAANLLLQSLSKGTIFSACSSECFTIGLEFNQLLLGLEQKDRPSLPSHFLNLSTLGLQQQHEQWFSEQLAHQAKSTDLLVIFCSNQAEKSIANCLTEANRIGLSTLLICPANNPLLSSISLQDSAVPLPLTNKKSERILQFSLSHLLVELVEHSLFGLSDHN